MEVGYRHFDTASYYRSEEPLGKAVAEALKRGLIKNRDEVFITSKLWCTDADPSLILPALKKTLGCVLYRILLVSFLPVKSIADTYV